MSYFNEERALIFLQFIYDDEELKEHLELNRRTYRRYVLDLMRENIGPVLPKKL